MHQPRGPARVLEHCCLNPQAQLMGELNNLTKSHSSVCLCVSTKKRLNERQQMTEKARECIREHIRRMFFSMKTGKPCGWCFIRYNRKQTFSPHFCADEKGRRFGNVSFCGAEMSLGKCFIVAAAVHHLLFFWLKKIE